MRSKARARTSTASERSEKPLAQRERKGQRPPIYERAVALAAILILEIKTYQAWAQAAVRAWIRYRDP